MSLHFRYKLVRAPRPVLPLGGRYVHPRPLVPVTLIGPVDSYVRYALLDTAADYVVFRETVAATIGIDLTNAPVGSATGAGMTNVPLRFARVMLRLASNQERREWNAWVGFTSASLTYPMLGFAGCLQFFDTWFRGALEEVELTVNSLYPGT
jgi:hypothetical protein